MTTDIVVQPEILLPDVQTKVAELQPLSGQDQGVAVTALLDQSRFGLRVAIAAQDLHAITEWKTKGHAVQEITKQLRLGKDMQLDAAEFVRRAERGLGVAIREGQLHGSIETFAETQRRAALAAVQSREVKAGRRSESLEDSDRKPTPTDFVSTSELQGQYHKERGRDGGIYGMTDGVSDEAFEAALAEAKEEENLSRANVARKSRAKAGGHIPPAPPRKVRKTAAARKVMDDLTITVNSLVFIINDTDPAEVECANHQADIEAIFQGMSRIKKFLNAVKEQPQL